jgi:hypothetical protein
MPGAASASVWCIEIGRWGLLKFLPKVSVQDGSTPPSAAAHLRKAWSETLSKRLPQSCMPAGQSALEVEGCRSVEAVARGLETKLDLLFVGATTS